MKAEEERKGNGRRIFVRFFKDMFFISYALKITMIFVVFDLESFLSSVTF